MQWEVIEDPEKEVFYSRITVLFVPSNELNSEEDASRDQPGPYDRLVQANFGQGSNSGQDYCEFESA